MPTYEYECGECHHAWELEQKITDAPAKGCPACERESARRIISRGTSFVLKGGGWFNDGYQRSQRGDA